MTSQNVLKYSKTENFDNKEDEIKFILSDAIPDFVPEYTLDSAATTKSIKSNISKEHLTFSRKLFEVKNISQNYYTNTQKWHGHVTELTEFGFKAILKDLTQGGTEEYLEVENSDITPDDKSLIALGAGFYMIIGSHLKNGTLKKESEIRFQRLADFDEDNINNIGLDLREKFIKFFDDPK